MRAGKLTLLPVDDSAGWLAGAVVEKACTLKNSATTRDQIQGSDVAQNLYHLLLTVGIHERVSPADLMVQDLYNTGRQQDS